MIFGFLGAGTRRLAVIVNEFGPAPRIFNFYLRLGSFIANRRGAWHGIDRRFHEVLARAAQNTYIAEAPMTAYIAGSHRDNREWL